MTQQSRPPRADRKKGVGRNYWMFVESPENFQIIKEMGLTLFGMGPKYRRRVERMSPNDRVLFYVKGIRKWPATATITSHGFQDDSALSSSHPRAARDSITASSSPPTSCWTNRTT